MEYYYLAPTEDHDEIHALLKKSAANYSLEDKESVIFLGKVACVHVVFNRKPSKKTEKILETGGFSKNNPYLNTEEGL